MIKLIYNSGVLTSVRYGCDTCERAFDVPLSEHPLDTESFVPPGWRKLFGCHFCPECEPRIP